jgi:hypothetical protein
MHETAVKEHVCDKLPKVEMAGHEKVQTTVCFKAYASGLKYPLGHVCQYVCQKKIARYGWNIAEHLFDLRFTDLRFMI